MLFPPRMRRLVCWLFGAALFVGCGSDATTENTGGLSLTLELANDVEIEEVTYSITRDGMEPMVGTINTGAPGSTASVEVYGLEAGPGYEVEMTAVSTDGETSCSGSADFAVEVGIATQVMVILNCKPNEQYGGVRVNGKFNFCADLIKVIVSPLQTSVGNQIDVFAQADDFEGDAVEYLWTGTGGSFDDPSAQETKYTCEEVGEQTITITVSDDGFQYCDCSWTVDITCVDGSGGGGMGGTAGAGGMGGTAGAGGMGGMAGAGGMGGTAGAGGMGGMAGAGGMGGTAGAGGMGGMAGAGGMGGMAGAGGMGGAGGGTGGTGGGGGCVPDKGAQDAGPGSRVCGESACGPLEVCVEGVCEDAALVFVSSELYTADLDGPRGADRLCAGLARDAGLGGYWMSWTSDECTSPQKRFHRSEIPYRLINGDQVAANWDDLIDGELDRDIRIDENGINLTTNCKVPGENEFCFVWTNTTMEGFTHFNDGCLGLTTDVSGFAPVQSGQWTRTQPGWTARQTKDCGQDLQAIYCFEQPESNQ